MSGDDTTGFVGWRKFPRHPATLLPSLRASILAGPDVRVINMARGGLLVESDVRLTPGSGVCLNLTVGDELYQVAGRICRVDAALINGKVTYRAGIALDEEMAIFDIPSGRPPSESPLPSGIETDAIGETAKDHVVEEYQSELEALRAELANQRREQVQQRTALETLTNAVQSGDAHRKQLLETQVAERAQWHEERGRLEERVRLAEDQVTELTRALRDLRDNERWLIQKHTQERAMLVAESAERQQQLIELNAVHTALLAEVTPRLEAYDRERVAWRSQQEHAASQLESTEGWCADQQDLLYRIRQQMTTMFALLEGDQRGLPQGAEQKLLTATGSEQDTLDFEPGSAINGESESSVLSTDAIAVA
jgi:hypothetical protein